MKVAPSTQCFAEALDLEHFVPWLRRFGSPEWPVAVRLLNRNRSLSSSNEVLPFSVLNESEAFLESMYPVPARVPPYVSAVESYSSDGKSLGHVKVELVPMTADHASWWHNHVQPIIKENYRIASKVGSQQIRADRNWNWKTSFQLLDVHNYGHFSTSSGYPAYGLTMIVRNGLDEDVIVGMMTLVPRYLCNANKIGSKTYTWYISGAPDEFYDEYFLGVRLAGVGKALFDAAIIASYRAGLDGSLFLHAASEGGKELVKLYKKLGFESVGFKVLPITLYRWLDRKGYMLLKREGAAKIIQRNDPYRRKDYVAE